jgi:hypothetical protein
MAAGEPVPIDEANASVTADQVGGEIAGMANFSPLWNWIVAEEPDLLD